MIWLVLAARGSRRRLRWARHRSAWTPRPFALAVYLLASAEVIALTEVLSLLGRITPGGYHPLYGPGLQRRVVPLPRHRPLAAAEHRKIHWVLLNRDAPRPAPRRGWRREDFPGSAFTLYSGLSGRRLLAGGRLFSRKLRLQLP